MKLVSSPASPFARKVRVVLQETGQAGDVEEVTVATTPLDSDAGLMAANPLAKLPALVLDDGTALYDSRVITRYLDARAGAGLYPEDRLWDVLTLEATADGIMDAAVIMVYEVRLRPETHRFPDWVEAQWGKVGRALDALDSRWIDRLNRPLDAGQIALGCALGYLDFRHEAREWRTGRAALAAWYAAFSQRPSMQITAPGAG